MMLLLSGIQPDYTTIWANTQGYPIMSTPETKAVVSVSDPYKAARLVIKDEVNLKMTADNVLLRVQNNKLLVKINDKNYLLKPGETIGDRTKVRLETIY